MSWNGSKTFLKEYNPTNRKTFINSCPTTGRNIKPQIVEN
jgi:hypothetical protein